jgi:catechol 2,3-dioxygenase-like lactoylglutathione lyase family enzyme
VRSTGLHHVDLVVSAIRRSLPFYTELLGPLGYYSVSQVEGERGETIWYLSGQDRGRRSTTGPPGCGPRMSKSKANRRSTHTCLGTTRHSFTILTV